MYARNNIIVWGTRGLMRLFAVLLAAADCGQDAMVVDRKQLCRCCEI
jgi:hypothetical protein